MYKKRRLLEFSMTLNHEIVIKNIKNVSATPLFISNKLKGEIGDRRKKKMVRYGITLSFFVVFVVFVLLFNFALFSHFEKD